MSKRECLRRIVANAEATVHLLSNRGRGERDRAACAALLRCLGVRFRQAELVVPPQDPPDVQFRSGRFELAWAFHPDRRPHNEWRERLERLRQAKSLEDAMEPMDRRPPLSQVQVAALVAKRLENKVHRYDPGARAGLDALVYAGLTPVPFPADMGFLHFVVTAGWRSVSVLMPPCAVVLRAEGSAPQFLRRRLGRTFNVSVSLLDNLFRLRASAGGRVNRK